MLQIGSFEWHIYHISVLESHHPAAKTRRAAPSLVDWGKQSEESSEKTPGLR